MRSLMQDVMSGFNYPLLASNPLATWGANARHTQSDQVRGIQLDNRQSSKKSRGISKKGTSKKPTVSYDLAATSPQSASKSLHPRGVVQISEHKQKQKKKGVVHNNMNSGRASFSPTNAIPSSSPQTPVTHRWSLRSADRHAKDLECTSAEVNGFTTPKPKLSQHISPEGYSAPRSLRSSARRLRSGHRLQYGSDVDAELFGVSNLDF
jgi:hypothetical protein